MMRKASEQDVFVQTAPTGAVSLSTSAPAKRRPAKLARGKLPRGIVEVRWENATTVDTVRYRVRIKRKDFKADKLFDTLLGAQEFLLMSKTRDGRLGLTEREARAVAIETYVRDQLSRRPLSFYAKLYIKELVDPKPDPGQASNGRRRVEEPNETKKRSMEIIKARINGLMKVKLLWQPVEEKQRSGLLSQHAAANTSSTIRSLGDFYLDEIDVGVANQFLKVRGETHAPSTVARERGQLQTIWSNLVHLDQGLTGKLRADNPWKNANKALIKLVDTSRERDLSEDEESRLLKSLSTCRNKQVPCVVGLALATGMRRSEVLMLEWRQIEDGFVNLRAVQTKRGKRRYVSLNADAIAIIEGWRAVRTPKGIKPEQRLFPMTINAFKKSWERARTRADLKDFRFHDTRRVAITKMLREMAFPSATLISSMTGMQSTAHIEREFVNPFEDRERARAGRVASEADIRADKGHADARMTKHYANLGPQPTRKKKE